MRWPGTNWSPAGPARALRRQAGQAGARRADGTSLSHVTAEIVDSRGRLVPDADDPIHFTVSGPGRLRAPITAARRTRPATRRRRMAAFNGLALAVVGSSQEGRRHPAHRAAEGLPKATVTLASVAPARPRHPPYPGLPPAPPRPRERRRARGTAGRPPPGRRGRQLLGCASHPACHDAGREPGHGLVELLRQGGQDRQPPRGQRG